MYYYTSESAHGSSTSFGFCNDTIVKVWNSFKDINDYIENSSNLSLKRIKRTEVTSHATNASMYTGDIIKPQPFTNEYWGIEKYSPYVDGKCIGVVEVCTDNSCEHLYK